MGSLSRFQRYSLQGVHRNLFEGLQNQRAEVVNDCVGTTNKKRLVRIPENFGVDIGGLMEKMVGNCVGEISNRLDCEGDALEDNLCPMADTTYAIKPLAMIHGIQYGCSESESDTETDSE